MLNIINIPTFTNTRQLEPLPFADYLAMPGYSHSFLKYNVCGLVPTIEPTDKMQLGSLVDGIISNTPVDATNAQYSNAKRIAGRIWNKYPFLRNTCVKYQVPCVGVVSYANLSLNIKCLTDIIVPKICTIELKVTDERDVTALIEYMGYDNQVYMQRELSGLPVGKILIYSTATDEVVLMDRPCVGSPTWLESKIIEFGTSKII